MWTRGLRLSLLSCFFCLLFFISGTVLSACSEPAGGKESSVETAQELGGTEKTVDASLPEEEKAPQEQEPVQEKVPEQPKEASVPKHLPNLKSPVSFDAGKDTIRVQPALAWGKSGNLAVSWTAGEKGSSLGIKVALYDAQGKVQVEPFRVDTYKGGLKNESAICGLSGGGYAVVWSMDTKDGSKTNLQVRFRILGEDGKPLKNEDTRVLSERPGNHWLAQVTCTKDGGFAVTGVRPDVNQKTFDIFVWRYNSKGEPQGKAIAAHDAPERSEGFPVIGAHDNNDLVVAWNESTQQTKRVMLRHFPQGGGAGKELVGFENPAESVAIATHGPSSHFTLAAFVGGRELQLKSYDNPGATGEKIQFSQPLTPLAVNPKLTYMGAEKNLAMIYFARTSASVILAKAVTFSTDGKVLGEFQLASGRLPFSYKPAISFRDSKLAVAWTERGASNTFVVKVSIFR